MKEYAEIHSYAGKGRVWGTHEMPDGLVPELNPNIFRFNVEITNLNPKPAVGWKYNLETEIFSEPDIVYLNSITSKEFFLRMTKTERENFISSVDPKVIQFHYWLSLSGNVDLNDTEIIQAINYLESQSIIGNGKALEILIIEEQ